MNKITAGSLSVLGFLLTAAPAGAIGVEIGSVRCETPDNITQATVGKRRGALTLTLIDEKGKTTIYKLSGPNDVGPLQQCRQ